MTVCSKVAWHKVDTRLIRKGGEEVRDAELIPLDTAGVVTVSEGKVLLFEVKISIQEQWVADQDAYSRGIYPVHVLKCDDRDNDIAVKLIERKCAGVRKCTGGFWKALAVGYIEHLLRKSTPINQLQQFLKWAADLLGRNVDASCVGLIEKLANLENYKREGKSAIKWIARQSKAASYWIQMAAFLRYSLFPYFREMPAIIACLSSSADLPAAQQGEIDRFSTIYPTVMALGLGLRLVLFSPHKYKTCYQTSEPDQHLAVLMMYADNEIYHLLYSKAMLNLENYNLELMVAGSGGELSPDLYYTTPKRTRRMDLDEKENEEIRRRTEKVGMAGLAAQRLILTLHAELGDIDQMAGSDFVSESQQFQQDYSHCFLLLKSFVDAHPSDNTDIAKQLLQKEFLTTLPLSSLRRVREFLLCQSCNQECPKEHFFNFCNCKVCIICQCDSYRNNPASCKCGQLQSSQFLLMLQSFQVLCPNCLKRKSAFHFISQVKCQDHCLCRECLTSGTMGAARCSYCRRVHSYKEREVISKMIQKKCRYFTEFCSKEILETECDCVICLKCAEGIVKTQQVYDKCFGCGQPLSSAASALLFSMFQDAREENIPPCAKCGSNISKREDVFQLGCGHAYHKICYRDHVTSTGNYISLTCLIASCEYRPSIRVLQKPIPDLYAKMHEAQKDVACPQCKAPVSKRQTGETLISEATCQNCRYHFCLFCLEPYLESHTVITCSERQLELETSYMQEQAKKTRSIMLHCPGCQHPLIPPSDDPEVQCQICSMCMCSKCGVAKHIYAVHGLAWHRPSCPSYCEESRNSGFCAQCRNTGRECTPPADLQ